MPRRQKASTIFSFRRNGRHSTVENGLTQKGTGFIRLLKILSYAKPVIPRPVRRLVVGIRSLFAGFLFRSDECFSFVGTVPPAAYFLSTATKSMQKTPFETDGFKTPFTFKRCIRYGPSRELTQQQPRSRSRSGEGACGSMVGSTDSHAGATPRLGMTDFSYEGSFQRPIKSMPS